MNDVYYFSHDSNARNDEKILMLRAEHGWEGYGLFWALIEMMFENEETCLHHNKIKGIALNCNIDITLLQNVIKTAISEKLFESDDKTFWSNSLRIRKEKYKENLEKKSIAGKKGMQKRWNNANNDNAAITPLYQCNNEDITENNKGKKRKEKESKEKELLSKDNTLPNGNCPHQEIMTLYHSECKSLPRIKEVTPARQDALRAWWKSGFTIQNFKEFFEKVESSDFLTGRQGNFKNCSFDWIIKPANRQKIIEGNYNDKKNSRFADYVT